MLNTYKRYVNISFPLFYFHVEETPGGLGISLMWSGKTRFSAGDEPASRCSEDARRIGIPKMGVGIAGIDPAKRSHGE
jgi:hypothetical protein